VDPGCHRLTQSFLAPASLLTGGRHGLLFPKNCSLKDPTSEPLTRVAAEMSGQAKDLPKGLLEKRVAKVLRAAFP
jgi:hypothetical protein